MDPKKPITRVLSAWEAKHLFERFEDVHCFHEQDGVVIAKCPGWDEALTHVVETEGGAVEKKGGCRYKDSRKLCNCLKTAAEGYYVVEIRPKNEDDLAKEREQERISLSEDLKKVKAQRAIIEEQILSIESKIRNL